MENKPTINDIAVEVGVSRTTISRFLNGKFEYMSGDTRQKIKDVIQKRGYVPSNVARTLKSKKSNLVGVVLNSLRYQIGAQTVTGINDICTQYGYGTMVCCSNDNPEMENSAIQLCLNQQVDGLIIIPCENSAEKYMGLCRKGIPVVLCTRYLSGWPFACVYVKHDKLIEQMLIHLKEQGFEKVCFLLDVQNFHKLSMGNSFSACAADLFGMSPEESVKLVGLKKPRISEAVEAFLKEYPGQHKAFMAVNTNTLFLTLKELMSRHMRIPEDVGICGYDAIGWSELVTPGISAIRQPMDKMGIVAAEELMNALLEKRLTSGNWALDGELFFRGSTQIKDLRD